MNEQELAGRCDADRAVRAGLVGSPAADQLLAPPGGWFNPAVIYKR